MILEAKRKKNPKNKNNLPIPHQTLNCKGKKGRENLKQTVDQITKTATETYLAWTIVYQLLK